MEDDDLNGATERYPLDVEKLTKGQLIPAAEVTRLLGVQLGDANAYRLAVLNLQGWIEHESADIGLYLHTCCRGDDIYVLTDEEDVDYQEKQHRIGIRKMMRSHRKAMEIDTALLSPEKQKKLIDNQRKQAWRIAALRGAVRKALKAADSEGKA